MCSNRYDSIGNNKWMCFLGVRLLLGPVGEFERLLLSCLVQPEDPENSREQGEV